MTFPHYHEDITHLHVGTLPNRAYFIPHGEKQTALDGRRNESSRMTLLSGDWHFGYYSSILDLPDDLFAPFATPDAIAVPSVWQCKGYDTHQYTNIRYPIPYDPPFVPVDNPCGLYSRIFSWQDTDNDVCTLHFEGVDSCMYVWVNQQFVGYSQVSHSTSAFDITRHIHNGENAITVLVLKWCDGTYFEDQDKFRMSGIFRDVYLLKRSASHLADYFVHTTLSSDLSCADIHVDLERIGAAPVSWQFFDANGAMICSGESSDDFIAFHLDDIHLWHSESPYLYTLLMHCGDEWIAEKVGLREIHVENGVVKLNGVALKFKGVNRHDSDPYVGPAVGYNEMLRDLRVMREHNINAIRTSHYPNAPEFLRMCDEYGFYVIDEADMECHGVLAYGSYNTLANDPVYQEVFLDRTQRCVVRDKNRPCVVMWSMGNESGHGCNFDKALAWTKAYDPSRLTHYERASFPPEGQEINKTDLDTYSRMYPSVADIDQYFEENKIGKPYILCEYCHAMGNGPGDLEEYFQCFHRHAGHCGGFVWEWSDHAIFMGYTADGKKKYFYGGDFGEKLHDGNFCVDGLVYPDRTPHTGLIEYKNVLRPARIVASNLSTGRFTIWNTLDFTNLQDAVSIVYRVRCSGRDVYTANIPADLLDIAPHACKEITLSMPANLPGEIAVHFSEYCLSGEKLVSAGHLVGEDEVGHQTCMGVHSLPSTIAITTQETARCIVLKGHNFRYVYNKTTAAFDEMVHDGHTMLIKPMHWNIWRAPTDNDRNIARKWIGSYYHDVSSRGYTTTLTHTKEGFQLETEFSLAAAYLPPVVRGKVQWLVKFNGEIVMSCDAIRRNQDAFLPRFGLRLFLPKSLSRIRYFGYGPLESYIDKHRSSFRNLYTSTLHEMHVDYLKPQENGSHYDCSLIQLQDAETMLQVSGESFSFNVSPYTQEELTNKSHNFELVDSGCTVLCVDAYQSGIGSNSCGPELREDYRIPANMHFSFTIGILQL